LADALDVAFDAECAQVIAHGTGLDAQLKHTLPSVETFTIFALCIGTVVLVVTQSRDVMDEYNEHELKKMLDAL
jgi:hypothetical protein